MIDQVDNVNESMSLFVEDNRNPCIMVSMDGVITHTNSLFENKFMLKSNDNFLSLLTRHGKQRWNDFKENSADATMCMFENLVLLSKGNVECLCKAHVHYCSNRNAATITFVLPAVCDELPDSAYVGCFTNASRTILMVDNEGVILDANNQVKDIFNLTRNAVIGKRIQTMYRRYNTQKSDGESKYAEYFKALRTYGEVLFTERFENNPNDIQFLEIHAVYNSDSDMYIVELQDRTEIEMLRRQLDHSGSLSTVGQMAASIAHEIRNPMTTLKGFVQLMEVTATGDTAKYLQVVDGELQRMESILKEMLMLSKPSEEKYSEFSLGVLITNVLEIMKPKAMFESIQIDWHDASFCNSMIYSNADKLKQVMLYLKMHLKRWNPVDC